MSFLSELKRRQVFRTAALYAVTSWLLLQVADVLFPNLGAPDWAFGLVLGILLLGFPLVLIFSWVYEVSPDGIRKEADLEHPDASGPHRRRLDLLIVGLLLLAIGLMALDQLGPDKVATGPEAPNAGLHPEQNPAAPGGDNSIAVLPFADLSPDGDQAYLSDGLSEELLNLLARIPQLRVASRTSAFSYKGKDTRIADIAADLGVAHVLEGSVRKSGNVVRITAQLVDARTDRQLWANRWDQTLEDVFAIQDDIAAAVIAALRVELLGEVPTAVATSPDAYTAYLQATHLSRLGEPGASEEAVRLFRQALDLDPTYAPAWIGLGTVYANLASARFRPADEAYAEALTAVTRAQELAPADPNGYAMRAWIAHLHEGDYPAAARDYSRALALDAHNARALNGVAQLLRSLGRLEESVRVHEALIASDPVNPGAFFNLGMVLVFSDDLDAARATFEKALDLAPDHVLSRVWMANIDYLRDNPERSLEQFEALSDDTGNELFSLVGRAQALPGMDRPEEGQQAMEMLEERWGRLFAYVIATIHGQNGDVDEAFEWLDRAWELNGPGALTDVRVETGLRPLHDDPRWPGILEKAGLTDSQVEGISRPRIAAP